MFWQIEIREKEGIFDAIGESIKKDICDLGISAAEEVHFIPAYIIEGSLKDNEVKRICEELLTDKVTQDYFIKKGDGSIFRDTPVDKKIEPSPFFPIEIAYNPGVMDPQEESILKGIRDLGINSVDSVRTAKKYLIKGRFSASQIKTISEKLLYNKLIQHIVRLPLEVSHLPVEYNFKLITVDLLGASDKELRKISKQGQLFLNLDEMRQIKKYFKKLKRNPTDCELETIAQTWSEHCGHKTFKGRIEYKEVTSDRRTVTRRINNLLKSTIMKVTKELNKPWCVSVFKDNSGIISFDDEYNVCFKVETHNHPSALEPFGGANTGLGGVIRDCLGTGLGGKPILNTDVFCFAPPEYPFSRLPKGSLHPKRVMKGVVSGVRDYGNKMGIPTVNGAVLFHERFVGNPLVYCGTAGIIPKDKSFKEARIGDLVVLAGGRTGRDGIHGATFSSAELTHESEVISSGAVQIGNPIQEKKILDTILQARDKNLYNAITDCGGGGLSSAVGEMGLDLGVDVYLEKVPLKYNGLSYTEIWISESQERMILSVPEKNIDELTEIFSRENVEAAVIGKFTGSRRLKLYYKDNLACDLDMQFLHNGLPRQEKKAVFIQPKHKEPAFPCPKDLTKYLLKLLSHYDICSKEWIIRQYDHEVQGGSALKPLSGSLNDGPSDAAIVKPLIGSSKGVIISCGINFRYGLIDPYRMAASCIDEALRQIIASGGALDEVALLDNFCWGSPDKPDRLGALVRAAIGCYDTAKGFGVPFISGKDSLNNEYTEKGRSISIPGTLLISAIAVMKDVNKAVSMYAKQQDGLIYVVGDTYDELGGSHYFDIFGFIGNSAPKVYPKKARRLFDALSEASSLGLIRAMHDCSDGGLGVALAEMAFSGNLGMDIFLSEVPYRERIAYSVERREKLSAKRYPLNARNDFILFSESNSRFVVEVERKKQKAFENLLKGLPFGLIGCVSKEKELKIYGAEGKVCIKAGLEALKEAWQRPLRW